jgi:hypothetical protein
VCDDVYVLRKKEFRVQLEAHVPDVGAPVDVGRTLVTGGRTWARNGRLICPAIPTST